MQKEWSNDNELFQKIKELLNTAVVGDIMDEMGYTHQFLPPAVQPLRDDMFVAGRAMTVLEADVIEDISKERHQSQNPILSRTFGLMIEALDDLKENEVYICSGASHDYAVWGELMSARAIQCKSAGAVVYGYSRDTIGILAQDFPCFSLGRYAKDQAPRGKVIDFRVPIEVEGVAVNSGDIVVGDLDGVCIVPQAIEEEVFALAFARIKEERTVLNKIKEGMSAREAFDTYGIL